MKTVIEMAREVGYPLVEYEGTPYIPPLLEVLLKTVAAERRIWVGLEKSDMPDGADPLFDDPKFIAGMVYAANKLMEKNT